jgi:putative endonuclease
VSLGKRGEEAAARLLAGLGYRILDRNWRAKTGELDLVAADGPTLVVVEVKSRAPGADYGSAAEAVTRAKQARLARTAALYLKAKGLRPVAVRFDVVAVEGGKVEHLPDAFPSPVRFTL